MDANYNLYNKGEKMNFDVIFLLCLFLFLVLGFIYEALFKE